ncbi:MAG TPA: hypothetical protein VGR14_10215 [Verrucomicrobiae bacterium]|jgi:hypothetical protein|nr:hypothetical protein [Verrucomicrobiae bacterium]
MKKCSDCGVEYPDEATQCVTCHTDLNAPSASPEQDFKTEPVMSPEEQQFWERMTFRQFTILLLRLQALWLVFDAVVEVTYLPPYFVGFNALSTYASRSPALGLGFFLALLRIILHVAAALALVMYSERVVSWFARDWFSKPSNAGSKSLQPTGAAPKEPSHD